MDLKAFLSAICCNHLFVYVRVSIQNQDMVFSRYLILLLTMRLDRTIVWVCSVFLGGQYESESKSWRHNEGVGAI